MSLPLEIGEVPFARPEDALNYVALMKPTINTISVGSVIFSTGETHYEPFVLNDTITVTGVFTEVTSILALTDIKIGIYNADKNLQPTSLVVDLGNISTSTTGVKSIVTAQILPKGKYLIALSTSGDVTFRAYRGGSYLTGISRAMGLNIITTMTAITPFAPYPALGIPWTVLNATSTPFLHSVFLDTDI